MKRFLIPVLFVLALAISFAGCEKVAPAPDNAVLIQAIQDNVHALEKKDIDAVMATIHPQARSFESTRQIVSEMFKAIDLKYTLSDLQVVSATADEAQVHFVQQTEKTGGDGQFQPNIVTGVHTLRPDQGKWKIYSTRQISVTGLDGKPLGRPEEPSPAPFTEPAPSPAPPTEQKPAAPEKPAQ